MRGDDVRQWCCTAAARFGCLPRPPCPWIPPYSLLLLVLFLFWLLHSLLSSPSSSRILLSPLCESVWPATPVRASTATSVFGAPAKGKSELAFLLLLSHESPSQMFLLVQAVRDRRPAMATDDSYNNELRSMGFRGDDEDDLSADAAELFGSNAAIDLDPEGLS